MTYEQVLAQPSAYVGKPVVWCLNTPPEGNSFVSSRQGWPVALSGSREEYMTTNNGGSAGYCFDVLAVIAGFERGVIQLRPVEKI